MVPFTVPYLLGSLARFLSILSWLSLDISQQESSAYLFDTKNKSHENLEQHFKFIQKMSTSLSLYIYIIKYQMHYGSWDRLQPPVTLIKISGGE